MSMGGGLSIFCYLQFLSWVSQQTLHNSFTSFSILISKFIEVIVNETVSLISLLGYLSLENRNAAAFVRIVKERDLGR